MKTRYWQCIDFPDTIYMWKNGKMVLASPITKWKWQNSCISSPSFKVGKELTYEEAKQLFPAAKL